ncbi:MAG: ArnT family glycosyltransferase [Candidatus Rokuibacteriota bacterium]
MSGERIWANSAVAGLLLLAALLIFANLDDRRLWDDEAETALLAQNTLRFGVPVAWDGVSLISQECGADYDENYLWRQTPWLPIYLAAASFALLDVSTFTARLPFALLGLLAVPSMYLLARRASADRVTAVIGAGSLLLSVPFLLHARQCRYYAVAIIAAIWVLYFFFLLPTRRRLAAAGLALALTVLLHASHLLFFGAVAGLALAALVVVRDRALLPWLGVAVAGSVVVNAPWLLGSSVGQTSGRLLALGSVKSFAWNLVGYATRIELYAFPAVLLAAALAVLVVATRSRPDLRSGGVRACLALCAFALGHTLVVSTVPFVFFRYVITLLPVFALLQAWAIRALASRSRVLAAAILVLALLPDRADLVRGRLSFTLARYLDEITHHVPGPIDGIVRHLAAAARPGDRLFISYGDLPLRFYTKLEIRGGQGCQSLAGWPPPDWVIVRYFFRFQPAAPGAQQDAERTLQYLKAEIPQHAYRRVDLPVADTIWENIPEPDRHVFREPAGGPKITVHEKARP